MVVHHEEELFYQYKALLFFIAYKMTGSVTDAEDIVQDTFLIYFQRERSSITNEKAYLCKIATNLCLDVLKSAKKKREVYVGPWLPEPYMISDDKEDPLHQVIKDDQLSYSYLVMMEKLSPNERVVFILREGYHFRYYDIAEMINKSEASCRKLSERAKGKIGSTIEKTTLNNERNRQVIIDFIEAFQQGNMKQVIRLVSEEVILYSDGGGIVKAAINPIYQRDRVIPFIRGIAAKMPNDFNMQLSTINGQLGLFNMIKNQPQSVISFQIQDEKIDRIYIVMNPEKLKHLSL